MSYLLLMIFFCYLIGNILLNVIKQCKENLTAGVPLACGLQKVFLPDDKICHIFDISTVHCRAT